MGLVFWGHFEESVFAGAKPGNVLRCSGASDADKLLANGGADSILFISEEVLVKDSVNVQRVAAAHKLPIVLTYQNSAQEVQFEALKKIPELNHLLPLNSSNTRLLLARLMSGTPFGPKLSDPPELSEVHERVFTNSGECEELYDELTEFALNLGCFQGFEGIARTAASELLTNAFYNGKRDPRTGQPLVTDRRVKFGLEKGETITFTYGNEADYLWLVVHDCFGSLERDMLVKAMTRVVIERTPRLDGPGGSGLGMIMLYEWATELNVFLAPKRSTVVSCKLKLTYRNRLFDAEPCALHIWL